MANGVLASSKNLTKYGIKNQIFSSGNTELQLFQNSSNFAELRAIGTDFYYSVSKYRNNYGLCSLKGLKRTLAKMSKPDLIVLHQIYTFSTILGYWYARKCRIPYAVFPHGSLTKYHETDNKLIKWIAKRIIFSRILHKANFIIVTCDNEKRDLRQSIQRKVVVLPYGAEFKKDLLEKRNASSGESQYARILFSGRFDKKKNLPLLLTALSQIVAIFPHVVLDLAGSGNKKEIDVLLKLVHQLKIENNVKFHGWLDKSEMEKLIISARLLVLPSDNENFGLVVSEALSAGVPCVVSKFVGTSDIVAKHHAGEIIEALTPESVAATIIKVLEGDETKYRESALTATLEDLDWAKIALKWRTLLT